MKSIITSIIFIIVGSFVFATSGFSHQGALSPNKQTHVSQTPNFLKLSPQQQETLRQKKFEFHKKLIPVFAELKVAQLELNQLEWANEPQIEMMTKKVEQISEIRQQIEMIHLSFRSEFRSSLTPEQRQQWKQQQSMIGSGMMHSLMGGQGMIDMMGSQGILGHQGMMDMMHSMMGHQGFMGGQGMMNMMHSMMGHPGMMGQEITPDKKSSMQANPEMMHEEEVKNQKNQ